MGEGRKVICGRRGNSDAILFMSSRSLEYSGRRREGRCSRCVTGDGERGVGPSALLHSAF